MKDFIQITNGLFYRRTKDGNIVLKRKQFAKMTIKKKELEKLRDILILET
jgi:hypothetical protein